MTSGYPIHPVGIVAYHVSRLHVSTRDREIIRDMRERCIRCNMPKEKRFEVYRTALAAHWQNRQICKDFRL